MLIRFPWTRWLRLIYAMRHEFEWKYHEFYQFRVLMGIMTGLLGRCEAPSGSGRMITSNTFASHLFLFNHSYWPLGFFSNNGRAAITTFEIYQRDMFNVLRLSAQNDITLDIKRSSQSSFDDGIIWPTDNRGFSRTLSTIYSNIWNVFCSLIRIILNPCADGLIWCFRLTNWFSLWRLGPWMNHLPPAW